MNATKPNDRLQDLRAARPCILPSFLLCDFGNLEREVRQLEEAGIQALHLDVMDGHFVPNLSYGMPVVEAIRKLTSLPIDVHLMISDPEKYVAAFVDAGSDLLTIHAEIEKPVEPVLDKIRSAGVGAGLAVNPGTPLTEVESLLLKCDLLLAMSVDAGFGGQKFNPVALEKLTEAKKLNSDLLLQVDGGVNLDTIAECRQAGADLFVVGSAIFGAADYGSAIEKLNSAVRI